MAPTDKPIPAIAAVRIDHGVGSTVRVDVPVSALEAGVRAEVETLTAQVHQALRDLDEVRRERNAAVERAQDCRDQLDEIRRELGAGPGVSALEAVQQAKKEYARADGDEWARAKVLDDIRAALGTDARGPGLVGAVSRLVDWHCELENAIRTLCKVLP